MSDTQIQLKGWPAVAVGAVAVLLLAFKVFLVHDTLGPEQLEEVRLALQARYSGARLDDLRTAMEGGSDAEAARVATEIQAMQKIEFVSIKARGTGPVIARLEIEVDGGDPPDGQRVRYYLLEHSTLAGWRVKRESSAWSYYTKLF